MDFKQIQELIKIVNRSNIGELSIEEGDFKIIIKQKEEPATVYTTNTPVQSYLPQATAVQSPSAVSQSATANLSSNSSEAGSGKQSDHLITIKSPMIGTFYRSSAPDKPAFVNIGDEITVGKTVCIIEAMKLFNEIESEVKGTIVKVLVDDASPVEYDQSLFLVEPA